MEIDTSGWQFLLVSLVPLDLTAMSFVILFFQSHYRRESRLTESTSACGARKSVWTSFHGACPLFFHLLAVDSLSPPDNGFSDRRRSMANVGVHSHISTKASSA